MTKSITLLSISIVLMIGGISYLMFFSGSGESISQVAKQNAFENATVHNEQGELIFSENQGVTTYILVDKIVYQIVYDQELDRYRILLATDKLEEAKKQAEEDFLSLVGLNPKDACSLNLEILALRTSGAMTPSYCL